MFDGNYRSNRRQVDLSGGGRRRKTAAGRSDNTLPVAIPGFAPSSSLPASSLMNPSSLVPATLSGGVGSAGGAGSTAAVVAGSSKGNRATLLDEARRLREARARHAEQIRSSTKIQKMYRGRRTRRELCRQLQQRQQLESVTLAERTTLLNVQLQLLSSTTKRPSDRERQVAQILKEYAAAVRNCGGADIAAPPPLAHRILAETFSALSTKRVSCDDARGVFAFALPPPSSSLNSREWSLQQLGGINGWTRMLETLQTLVEDDDVNNTLNRMGDGASRLAADLWSLAVSVAPDSIHGRAALGVVAFSQPPSALGGFGSKESLLLWFSSMVHVLSDPRLDVTKDSIGSSVSRMHPRRTANVLQNAMTLFNAVGTTKSPSENGTSPAPLVRYLRLLPDRIVALSSFLARGDGFVRSISDGEADASLVDKPATTNANDVDDDDDDSDWDEKDSPRARATALAAAAAAQGAKDKASSANNSSRLTKQELQTLTKIDRSYRQAVLNWRASVVLDGDGAVARSSSIRAPSKSTVSETELELARLLCLPDRWLQWGKYLLSNAREFILSETDDSMNASVSAVEAFVSVLGALLQSTTGLRARDSVGSQFLAVLAMDATFLELLWGYISALVESDARRREQQFKKRQPTSRILYAALSLFCDVFAHRLLAMRDNQFLSEYTSIGSGNEPRISAERVVVTVRDVLHEVYWSRPVRARHVVPPGSVLVDVGAGDMAHQEAVRGRLLLTGTKLWQALYERWCRLVRQAPFCDESAWWFPHMTSLSSEDTVVGMRNGGDHHSGGADDMDLESSDDENEVNSVPEPMAVDVENEAFADAFSDAKMARILTSIPQAFPFERRVMLFHSLLATDKQRTQDEQADMHNAMMMIMRGQEGEISSRERVSIHRDRLYEDSMQQLNRLGPKLRKRVQVSFINQYGQDEAGIDGGGVFKEFVDDLIKEAFSVESSKSLQLFSVTPLQTLAVNTRLPMNATLLTHYEFLGRVLGKAVYESILVEPQFCLPFLNQLLGRSNSLEDLKNFDHEFYQNLTKLLSMSSEDVDGLGLTFDLNLGEGREIAETVELVPGGRTKHVTKSNVIQYVHLVANQRLNVESASQTKAFLRGFRDLIPASWVRLFSSYELQKLISGDDSIRGIDVESLKKSMQYAAGYHPSQTVVSWFWEILEEMSAEQQRLFLKFMTSCSRQPLLGFSSLEPAPCIQQIRLPDDLKSSADGDKNAPLPTSATCMNLLKLPNYWSKELMRQKLLAAIESGAGFELT
jgi:ubiquitin-protein ligase E3 C